MLLQATGKTLKGIQTSWEAVESQSSGLSFPHTNLGLSLKESVRPREDRPCCNRQGAGAAKTSRSAPRGERTKRERVTNTALVDIGGNTPKVSITPREAARVGGDIYSCPVSP
jgi:hypothetical protein